MGIGNKCWTKSSNFGRLMCTLELNSGKIELAKFNKVKYICSQIIKMLIDMLKVFFKN